MTKIEAYKVSAQYCAFVHLGYIPEKPHLGICDNLASYLAYKGLRWIDSARLIQCDLRLLFAREGLDSIYPVENGDAKRYSQTKDKYRGPLGYQRRDLALKMATYLKEKYDDED